MFFHITDLYRQLTPGWIGGNQNNELCLYLQGLFSHLLDFLLLMAAHIVEASAGSDL